MKNRIKISKTTYYVDVENKVVICKLDCDMQLFKHPSYIYINRSLWFEKFPNVDFNGKFTVVAKAKCDTIDDFDEVKGKRIAESKAKAKMFKLASKVYLECHSALMEYVTPILQSSEACFDAYLRERNHVKELSI